MTEVLTVQQLFWEKVWRCKHRHPCKKCCWPWKACNLTVQWRELWHKHFTVSLSLDGQKLVGPAHRIAYEIQYGPIAFRGHRFHFCHQCDFGPCCNPLHVKPGAPADNARDRRQARANGRFPIVLPDGRIWRYEDAYDERYYLEACSFERIWAGPLPPINKNESRLWDLTKPPTQQTWPGKWPHKKVKIEKELREDDLATIQQTFKALARQYGVSVPFLCYLALRPSQN